MENASSPSTPCFWRTEPYTESGTEQLTEAVSHLSITLNEAPYEEPVASQQSEEVPVSNIYCNIASLMPNQLAGASSLHVEIPNEPEAEVRPIEDVIHKRSRSNTLAQLLMDELQDVSDDIFFETKWKIIDILRDAQKKQRNQRALMERVMRDRVESNSSSPSIITLPSPSPSSTSPLLSEWGYEEQH